MFHYLKKETFYKFLINNFLKYYSFSYLFKSPEHFRREKPSASELIRFHYRMAASKPTSWLSLVFPQSFQHFTSNKGP